MHKTGRIIGILFMLGLGVLLVYFAVHPPKLFVFLYGHAERIGCGIIGIFLIAASMMNLFHKHTNDN